MAYLKNILSAKKTPQNAPIPGSAQVPNAAGGYAFPVDDRMRLERFLILGSEGGSYYAAERKLTLDNAETVLRGIAAEGPETVARIAAISEEGRAPKNDQAIFALALAASYGDDETRRVAFAALPRVCRTGTHLFQFAGHVDGMRGWGRGLRAAFANWYNRLAPEALAYQAVKYQQREGWSHRDLLRLAHPVASNPQTEAIYHWITRGWPGVGDAPHPDAALQTIWAMERAKQATTAAEVAALIRVYRLPREAVPTVWLSDPAIWGALLKVGMPITALIRNLATLTRVGALADREVIEDVAAQIADPERLKRGRVHPIALLAALTTYSQGHGDRGKNSWTPIPRIVDALDAAFYMAFQGVEPTGKRHLLALDVSGSMGACSVAGILGLTPRVASAAMALITAATEPEYQAVAFTAGPAGMGGRWGGGDSGLTPLSISPRQRLDDVVKSISELPMGGTDCALPMVWARKNRLEVDAFVIYTDNETWHGDIHPSQALREYRDAMGIPAKLIVVSMLANAFTIADPADAGMFDIVGFDTAAPALMADFVR